MTLMMTLRWWYRHRLRCDDSDNDNSDTDNEIMTATLMTQSWWHRRWHTSAGSLLNTSYVCFMVLTMSSCSSLSFCCVYSRWVLYNTHDTVTPTHLTYIVTNMAICDIYGDTHDSIVTHMTFIVHHMTCIVPHMTCIVTCMTYMVTCATSIVWHTLWWIWHTLGEHMWHIWWMTHMTTTWHKTDKNDTVIHVTYIMTQTQQHDDKHDIPNDPNTIIW